MREATKKDTDVSPVQRVWEELMPGCVFDRRLTWSEAGVDSLKSLHYLLRLEAITGKKVSFDLFARDTTLGDLSDALSCQAPPREELPERRTLFLFPGIFGDEPRLGNLRRALRHKVACQTLELADLWQPAAILGDVAETTALLVSEITRRQPEGPIALAGYSFGGFLAYQAALDLANAGRRVDLLCLLDTLTASAEQKATAEDAPASVGSGPPKLVKRFGLKTGEGLYAYVERIAFRFSQRFGFLELARRIVVFSWQNYGFAKANERRHDLLWAFRVRAMRNWRPPVCSAPALLIASDDCIRAGSQAVWSSLCPNLTVRYVGGHHSGIFDPHPMTILIPALLEALGLDEDEMTGARERVTAHPL